MILPQLVSLAWSTFKTDRAVQLGTGTSGVSLWGAHSIASISVAQAWVALFAATFGGLSALATFIYMVLKIRRMIKRPDATE